MSSGDSSSEYEFELQLDISDDRYYRYIKDPPQPTPYSSPEQQSSPQESPLPQSPLQEWPQQEWLEQESPQRESPQQESAPPVVTRSSSSPRFLSPRVAPTPPPSATPLHPPQPQQPPQSQSQSQPQPHPEPELESQVRQQSQSQSQSQPQPQPQPQSPEPAPPATVASPPQVVQPREKPWAYGEHLFKLKQFPPKEVDLQIPRYGAPTIQHSLPAYDLWRPFFPTHLSDEGFRNFHRPKLRHFKVGPQALSRRKRSIKFPVKNVARLVYKNQKKLRYQVIRAINEGMSHEEIVRNFLLIRQAKDLTAKSGEQFFFEYMEEFPPVLNQIGMASNIKNYVIPSSQPVTRKPPPPPPRPPPPPPPLPGQEQQVPTLSSAGLGGDEPGTGAAHTNSTTDIGSAPNSADLSFNSQGNYRVGFDEQPHLPNRFKNNQLYYCQFNPGTKLKVIENNMYRAPIYEQREPMTDFLVIRTRNSFYIRLIKNLYVVGQTFPLVAIPSPRDGVILQFRTKFSNAYVHKIFTASRSKPPALDLNQLNKLFPDYSRSSLRDRLKRYGAIYIKERESFIKGNCKYGSMTVQELRRYFTPEQYCLNMAMLAARERLKQLSYTDTMILPPTEDNEKETEVLAAPWNTSQALLNAISGKSYLDLKKHLVDPTGPTNAGFSCVTWVKSPTEEEQMKEQLKAKSVLGSTQNDLSSIPKVNPLAQKIKREKLERLAIYQKAAREIAELQALTLSQRESDSSDDESDHRADEDEKKMDESFEREFNKLNTLVEEGKTVEEFDNEQEEVERQEMLRQFKMLPNLNSSTPQSGIKSPEKNSVSYFKNKILKITRYYDIVEDETVERIERTEIVRDPKIISLYVRKKKAEQSLNSSQDSNVPTTNVYNTCSQPTMASERRASLGESELCRADGIVLTISKKVLDSKAMRKIRKELQDTSL